MELVNLDIGGTIFRFRRDTLTQYPDTMLGAMFSKDNPGDNTYEKDGKTYYYFDRNPEIFRIVANFYRSGRYDIMARPTECSYKTVADELDFWCIPEEACASADVCMIANMLCATISHTPLIISNQMLGKQYWKDGNVQKNIEISGTTIDMSATNKMLNKISKGIQPRYPVISALRRKGINVAIEFTEFKCNYFCTRLLCESDSRIAITSVRACCNGPCHYEDGSGFDRVYNKTDHRCEVMTVPLLTIKRID
jgi:hypothetical protein